MEWADENLIKVLSGGGVVVMPTDTLYGIVGVARDASVVNRIYLLRKRSPDKRCIILIGDMSQLDKFSVIPSKEQKTEIKKYWPASPSLGGPGPVSIVLDCPDEKFAYLHRGTKTLAFRLPAPKGLRDLLKKVGPIIAPSANPQGLTPAQNIAEAKKYFGDSADLYVDGGTLAGKASKVIRLHKDASISIIRE